MTDVRSMMTADQLLRLSDSTGPCELVRGMLVREPPAGDEHGRCAARVLLRIGAFVEEHDLGVVYAAETGFLLRRDPDTVRAPDCAFLARERSATRTPGDGFVEHAPDLVVEVLSPSDRLGAVNQKVADWIEAGTRAVLIVDPIRESVTIHRADRDPKCLAIGDTLQVTDVLPGFECAIASLFAR